MAKREAVVGKKQPEATVVRGEAPLSGFKSSPKSLNNGKLLPKNKSRLPRRQKKAKQKAAGRL